MPDQQPGRDQNKRALQRRPERGGTSTRGRRVRTGGSAVDTKRESRPISGVCHTDNARSTPNIIYQQTHPIELLEQATIDEYDILYR